MWVQGTANPTLEKGKGSPRTKAWSQKREQDRELWWVVLMGKPESLEPENMTKEPQDANSCYMNLPLPLFQRGAQVRTLLPWRREHPSSAWFCSKLLRDPCNASLPFH